jgi:hypothetical protein
MTVLLNSSTVALTQPVREHESGSEHRLADERCAGLAVVYIVNRWRLGFRWTCVAVDCPPPEKVVAGVRVCDGGRGSSPWNADHHGLWRQRLEFGSQGDEYFDRYSDALCFAGAGADSDGDNHSAVGPRR